VGVLAGLPRAVLVLGLVSMLTDVAGEMVQPLLPLYLVAIGAGPVAIGLVEGAAEAAVSLVKLGSGRMADRLPRRKPLVVAGYGLAALAKPALAAALVWPAVLGLRVADRVAKGIRGAPRDAMIGDLAAAESRGLAFGYHRAADTAGAIAGPLLALGLLAAWGQSPGAMRMVFLATALPMALAVGLLVFGVREGAVPRSAERRARKPLPRRFLAFLPLAALLGMGPVLLPFTLLRAQSLGADLEQSLSLYAGFNVVYAAVSIPAGHASDRRGRAPVLLGGSVVFVGTSAGFALAPSLPWLLLLFAGFGVFMAAVETVGRAYAVDLAPSEARATALGAYHGVVGLAALPIGLGVGLAWEWIGPAAAFGFAAFLGLIAVTGLVAHESRFRGHPRNALQR